MNAVLTAERYIGPGITANALQRLPSNDFAAIVAGTGTLAAVGTTYVLPAAGFCAAGIKAGSFAAGVQASIYGAAIPAGSIVATLQSWGATVAFAGTLGAAAVPVGAVVASGTYFAVKALRG